MGMLSAQFAWGLEHGHLSVLFLLDGPNQLLGKHRVRRAYAADRCLERPTQEREVEAC